MVPFVTRRPRVGIRAAIAALLVIALLVAGCATGPAADSPGGVVQDALGKVAAKDVEGLRALACAGQEDLIRSQLGLPASIGSQLLPGVDTQALVDAVNVDVSKVQVGDATISGDTAEVPLSGDLGVTFDAAKLRPILKQVMASQGTSMTDAQLDALLNALEAYGQAVPVDQTIRLVRENGTWKICQQTLPSPVP